MKIERADVVAGLRLLVVAAFLVFASYGCGGGGSTSPSAPVAPLPHRPDIHYGFYGTWDGTQVSETAAFVDFVWVTASPVGIVQLQEAHMRGVKNSVADVMWQVYRPTGQKSRKGDDVFEPSPAAEDNLRAFLFDARNAGVELTALYPIDEPDKRLISADQVCATNALVRRVAAEFKLAPRLLVIYGGDGTPGIGCYDDVGLDDYGNVGGAISAIDALPLRAEQRRILVPGGACPWQNDPQPFIDKAESDPTVAWVVAFLWTDYVGPDGQAQCGIRNNPTRKAYEAAGATLITR